MAAYRIASRLVSRLVSVQVRPDLGYAAAALVLGALLRAASAWPVLPAGVVWGASGACWALAYALWLWHMFPILSAARSDGGTECEEILTPQE